MIEINLLPGSERRTKRKSAGIALPKLGDKLPKPDKWAAGIVVAWAVGIGVLAWLYLSTEARREELTTAIETAEQDSIRYAQIIETTTRLRARRDSIAEKLQIIQQIDASRYVWPHIMDEVSRALPEYTWLTSLSQTAGGPQPQFRIEGRTGTTFALTRYLDALEASPFVAQVKLESTRRQEVEGRALYEFILTARYDDPPSDLVETVPVFSIEEEAELTPEGSPSTEAAGASAGPGRS